MPPAPGNAEWTASPALCGVSQWFAPAARAIACLLVGAGAEDEKLAGYRSSIDNIDAALILLLAERFKVTKQIGVYKASVGLPAADPQREEQQIARLRELAASANLDPSFSEKFLRFVIDEVIRHHDLARNEAGAAGDQEAERAGGKS